MTKKLIIWLAGTFTVQSALALSQRPAEAKNCGANPFYVLVVGFSQVCSEKFPEIAPSYKIALAKIVSENPSIYAKMDANTEFQETLQRLLPKIEKMLVEDLENECARLLQEGEKYGLMKK